MCKYKIIYFYFLFFSYYQLSLSTQYTYNKSLFCTQKTNIIPILSTQSLTYQKKKKKKKNPSQVSPDKSPHLPLKYHHLLQVALALSLSLSLAYQTSPVPR